MKNFSRFSTHVKTFRKKIYSLENIFSNQWVLIYPMQAIPAILFQFLKRRLKA